MDVPKKHGKKGSREEMERIREPLARKSVFQAIVAGLLRAEIEGLEMGVEMGGRMRDISEEMEMVVDHRKGEEGERGRARERG